MILVRDIIAMVGDFARSTRLDDRASSRSSSRRGAKEVCPLRWATLSRGLCPSCASVVLVSMRRGALTHLCVGVACVITSRYTFGDILDST